MNKDLNIFQQIIRNEATWIAGIVIAIWQIFTQMVIPINNIQLGLAQVQLQLTTQTKLYSTLSTQVQTISTKQQVDEQILSQITLNK